jgi:hypothetical protein
MKGEGEAKKAKKSKEAKSFFLSCLPLFAFFASL